MVFTEKFDKLCSYESYEKLSDDDIDLIYRLSYDTNSFIRALAAEILAKIPNERSKSILFMLANDRHCFVRTEAYDSLSVFSDKETARLLAKKISSESDDLALSYAVISFAQIYRIVCMAVSLLSNDLIPGLASCGAFFLKKRKSIAVGGVSVL